jgi:hypothetical protein
MPSLVSETISERNPVMDKRADDSRVPLRQAHSALLLRHACAAAALLVS